ncbi:MAG: hypothetical protein BGO69_17045 [Bacteroidetes bacterium 46-16]|nr:MAG: hypothetical protein BGO69_17045 [Bacteroidetes bacterium 46-16]
MVISSFWIMPHAWDNALERVLCCRLWMAQLMVIRRDSLSTLVAMLVDFNCYKKECGLKSLIACGKQSICTKGKTGKVLAKRIQVESEGYFTKHRSGDWRLSQLNNA